MKLDEVNVRNYKLRDNIKSEIEEHIADEISQLPIDGAIKATLVDQGKSFNISAVAVVDKKIFNADVTYVKEKTIGYPRNWQLDAFKKVFADVIRQIKKAINLK